MAEWRPFLASRSHSKHSAESVTHCPPPSAFHLLPSSFIFSLHPNTHFAYSPPMEQSRPDLVPNPAVRRLSLYLRQLESFKRKDRRTVSSKQLGESLNLTDAQVRKDLAYFGQFGHPGIGYRVDDLIAQVKRILGTDKVWDVLLVGAGNLGRALSGYKGFNAKGFRLMAIFDADAAKVGRKLGPFLIQPISELKETVQKQQIRLGMVAVPADHAQGGVDQLA